MEYHIQLRVNRHQGEARRKDRNAQLRKEQGVELQRHLEEEQLEVLRTEAGGLLTTGTRSTLHLLLLLRASV